MISNQWVGLMSAFIPDCVKSHEWRMWEYRNLHIGINRRYGIKNAYEFTKLTVGTYELIRRYAR